MPPMKVMPGQNTALLIGRILVSALFFIQGMQKVANYEGTQVYMMLMGVPGTLLPWVILLEVVGSVCIVLGLFTRVISLLFVAFCLLTALFFHTDFSHPIEVTSFFKNFAIAGGFLFLYASGPGKFSLSYWLERGRGVRSS